MLPLVGFYACANTGRISGGPKDVTPPVLDTLLSTPDKQTNIYPRVLTFYFDEFVEVKDPIKQVIVSPPLTYIPSIKSRGKKVIFTFDEKEELREDATYTINFGEAIVDFHEGNKLLNFTHVFSTGDYLDSLNISGKIIHAKTGEPEQEMIVVLYDSQEDSIVRKEKPFYFTRPDRKGDFIFRNIKSGVFKIFALKDDNLNYKYDLETERIAFHDEPLSLLGNSIDSVILRSSLPIPPLKLKTKNLKTYGKAVLAYNTSVSQDIVVSVHPADVNFFTEIQSDSLGIYYDTALDSLFFFAGMDTVKIFPKGKKEWLSKTKLLVTSPMHKRKIHPADSVVVAFNYPIQDVDVNLFKLSDSLGMLEGATITLDKTHKNVIIRYPWDLGEKYKIELDSGVVHSIYGHANPKALVEFEALSLGTSGKLIVDITDLDSTKNYMVHILKNKLPIYGYAFDNVGNAHIELSLLEPSKYDIEIFEDDNRNGVWDPGDYYQHRQPEVNFLHKGDILKVNRDNKVAISWTRALQSLLESHDPGSGKIDNPFENRK